MSLWEEYPLPNVAETHFSRLRFWYHLLLQSSEASNAILYPCPQTCLNIHCQTANDLGLVALHPQSSEASGASMYLSQQTFPSTRYQRPFYPAHWGPVHQSSAMSLEIAYLVLQTYPSKHHQTAYARPVAVHHYTPASSFQNTNRNPKTAPQLVSKPQLANLKIPKTKQCTPITANLIEKARTRSGGYGGLSRREMGPLLRRNHSAC
mmetsp:Transcript_25498/g.41142  ORF Transcript_25498/g.41142 Transcript_25498/m.41142 type:complete len:207 (+) Transcript_25498:549-1169(+)